MPFIGLSKPKEQAVSEALLVGDKVPLSLAFESTSKSEYTLVVFLRHTGCPFAEAALKSLSALTGEGAQAHNLLNCVAVCHGDAEVAKAWINQLKLSDSIQIIFDEQRQIYGRWGIGYSPLSSLLNSMMIVNLVKLWFKGIRNRDASGTRWQKQVCFLLKSDGQVLWKHEPLHAGDLPDFSQITSFLR